MTRRSRVRIGAGVLFSLVNFAGGVAAAASGELAHASVHAALLLLGVLYASRVWSSGKAAIASPDVNGELTERLAKLEMTVEAAAMAVERVGEGQRFMTHLLAGHDAPPAPDEGATEPVEIGTQEETARIRRPGRPPDQ